MAADLRALLEAQAAARPDAPFAIEAETGRTLTFGDLRAVALTIARRLADEGLGAGDRVGLCVPNGVEAVALFVGVIAAGCVATPLSLLATPEQLGFALDHSRARFVFAGPQQAETLARVQQRAPVETVCAPFALSAGEWPLPPPCANDDALLMYTSGTTGRPKGVRLTQGAILAGARFVSEAHELGPRDRVLAVLPLYHINAQIVTVLAPLWGGGSLVMPQRFSVGSFWKWAAEYRCSWLNVVPTMIAYLLNAPDPLGDVSAVRFCRSASAPLPAEHLSAFERRFEIGVLETMGLTETAAPVLTNPLRRDLRKPGSAGQAFGNRARIVDPNNGDVLGDDEEGEIQIQGPNVMAGYLDDPAETAKAFTSDGWLRTGDLGRRDHDGFHFITGRLKELIIKGGENIAPREIDEALLRHPAVLEAAAYGVGHPLYGQEVEAAAVLKSGAEVSEEALLQTCRTLVGAFKCPRAIHFLLELPKGPSGKLQRLRLPS
jgi:long-chain acyl-CoA synthetase